MAQFIVGERAGPLAGRILVFQTECFLPRRRANFPGAGARGHAQRQQVPDVVGAKLEVQIESRARGRFTQQHIPLQIDRIMPQLPDHPFGQVIFARDFASGEFLADIGDPAAVAYSFSIQDDFQGGIIGW